MRESQWLEGIGKNNKIISRYDMKESNREILYLQWYIMVNSVKKISWNLHFIFTYYSGIEWNNSSLSKNHIYNTFISWYLKKILFHVFSYSLCTIFKYWF